MSDAKVAPEGLPPDLRAKVQTSVEAPSTQKNLERLLRDLHATEAKLHDARRVDPDALVSPFTV